VRVYCAGGNGCERGMSTLVDGHMLTGSVGRVMIGMSVSRCHCVPEGVP
jgi:hypothetical protein